MPTASVRSIITDSAGISRVIGRGCAISVGSENGELDGEFVLLMQELHGDPSTFILDIEGQNITGVSAPNLVLHNAPQVVIAGCPATFISFPVLNEIGTAGQLFLSYMQVQGRVTFPSLSVIRGNLSISLLGSACTSASFPRLATLYFNGLANGIFRFTGCPSCTSIEIPSIISISNNFTFDVSANGLSTESVNNILISLNRAIGATTGATFDLSGGTNASPTGEGLAAYNSLRQNNTVSVN